MTHIRIVPREELEQNRFSWAEKIAAVSSDGFGPDKEMDPERMARRLQREPYLAVAEEDDELVGFQIMSLDAINGERFMYFSHAVAKSHQANGLGALLLAVSIAAYSPTVVGARSQNPASVASFVKAMKRQGISDVFPFGNAAEQSAQMSVPAFLAQLSLNGTIDPHNGLNRDAYPEGRLGDYIVDARNPRTAKVEAYMQSIGLDRVAGDALFYCARVAPPYQ